MRRHCDGCDGAPSRDLLGEYFPSWMVCVRRHVPDVAYLAVLMNVS
jgi:hypothetical protein